MTIDEIKELIQVVNESGIAELEFSRGDSRVRIRRNLAPKSQEFVIPASPVLATPIQAAVSANPIASAQTAISAQPPPATTDVAPADNAVYIKSPIVGTYYDSPSPGSPSFVRVGDRVSTGQVLCIIESMKLMNEIESELSGTVTAKLVENGKPVEYGEPLFAVEPA